jgi:hypothetical protein
MMSSLYATVKLHHAVFTTALMELSLQCLSTHSLPLRKRRQRKWECNDRCCQNETC